MSYRLKTNETLALGLRRIAREELESAVCQINKARAGEEAAAVHATRKHIKKLRALLRLIRSEIGQEIFTEENGRLRDVARGFSGSRDARVQLQSLEKLGAQAAQEKNAFAKTSAALEEEMAAQADTFGPHRREAESILQQMCDRLEGWPLDDLEMKDLCCGLRHSYKRGRKCFDEVGAKPTTENFHSWRKRVKDIWYQARLLQNLNQAVIRELAEAAKTLGQRLGDLHDLAFFRLRLEAEEGCREDERSVLLGLICTRERELEEITLDLGARFFAEKPGVFEKRLLRYARGWRTSRT
ncbi:MAG TPA: CHAD domain-containing protein [Chthoniobacterales bacterium]|jgi:CHAD domain-containing protein|nr:CHAD domain-containing protein [Chthoniobacterales bacterium]